RTVAPQQRSTSHPRTPGPSPHARPVAVTHPRPPAPTPGAQHPTTRPPPHEAQDATSQHHSNLRVQFLMHDTSFCDAIKASSLAWASAWATWVAATVPPKEARASSVRLPYQAVRPPTRRTAAR